jgi:hypothetical protein
MKGRRPQIGRDILPPGDLAPYNRFGVMPYGHRSDIMMRFGPLMGTTLGVGSNFNPWARRNLPRLGGYEPSRRSHPSDYGPGGGYYDGYGGLHGGHGGGYHGGHIRCGGRSRSRRQAVMPWYHPNFNRSHGHGPRRGHSLQPPAMMYHPNYEAMTGYPRLPKMHPLYVDPKRPHHRYPPSIRGGRGMDMMYDYDDDVTDYYSDDEDYDDVSDDEEMGYPGMSYGFGRGMDRYYGD